MSTGKSTEPILPHLLAFCTLVSKSIATVPDRVLVHSRFNPPSTLDFDRLTPQRHPKKGVVRG